MESDRDMAQKSSSYSIKTGIILALIILAAAVLVFFVLRTGSQTIHTTIDGTSYQLGTEEHVMQDTVIIDGKVSTDWLGKRTFKGTIILQNNHDIPVPKESRKVTIPFQKNGYGSIVYQFIQKNSDGSVTPEHYDDGAIFANSDFSKVTLIRLDHSVSTDGAAHGSWSAADGLMFAGPAATRDEALKLSNDLMSEYLTNESDPNGRFTLQ